MSTNEIQWLADGLHVSLSDAGVRQLHAYIGCVATLLSAVIVVIVVFIVVPHYRKRRHSSKRRGHLSAERNAGHRQQDGVDIVTAPSTRHERESRRDENERDLYDYIADEDVLFHDINTTPKPDDQTEASSLLPDSSSPTEHSYLELVGSAPDYAYAYSSSPATKQEDTDTPQSPNEGTTNRSDSPQNETAPDAGCSRKSTETTLTYTDTTNSSANQTDTQTQEGAISFLESPTAESSGYQRLQQPTQLPYTGLHDINRYAFPHSEELTENPTNSEQTIPKYKDVCNSSSSSRHPSIVDHYKYTDATSSKVSQQGQEKEGTPHYTDATSSKVSDGGQEKQGTLYYTDATSSKVSQLDHEKRETQNYTDATSSKVSDGAQEKHGTLYYTDATSSKFSLQDQENREMPYYTEATSSELIKPEIEREDMDAEASLTHSSGDPNYEKLNKTRPASYTRLRFIKKTQ